MRVPVAKAVAKGAVLEAGVRRFASPSQFPRNLLHCTGVEPKTRRYQTAPRTDVQPESGQDGFQNAPMDVRQPEVTAGMVEG